MHMTKHVAGVYSTTPGPVTIPEPAPAPATTPIADRAEGPATVAAHTVVYGGAGTPEWGLAVCDLPGARTYARIEDADLLADAAAGEWAGRSVTLAPHPSRDNANLVVA
jgi:hypothetical protein